MSEERQTPPLFMDNLHPLESKVLLALAQPQSAPPTLDQLTSSTGLEPSQLSMAVEWLLAKSLIAVHAETVAHIASLTPTGRRFSISLHRSNVCSRRLGRPGRPGSG